MTHCDMKMGQVQLKRKWSKICVNLKKFLYSIGVMCKLHNDFMILCLFD